MAESKDITIFEMEKGSRIVGFFPVKSSETAETPEGIRQVRITVYDKTGTITCTMGLESIDAFWGQKLPEKGEIVKILGTVAENPSAKEIHLEKIRRKEEADNVDMAAFEHTSLTRVKKGDQICDIYLVKQACERQDKKGNWYLDLNVGDRTGELNCKLWNWKIGSNDTRKVPEPGTVVFVRGTIDEYNGRIQFKLDKMIPYVPTAEVLMSLVPCAPETPESMLDEIESVIDSFHSENLQRIVREVMQMVGGSLEYFPAAQRIHHAERSGLLHHTLSMLRMAQHIIQVYPFLNGDLLCAGVILHDLCKTTEMKSDEYGNVTDYTREGLLVGHLVKGVTLIDKAAEKLGISGEMVLLLEHMVLSHHGEAEFGSPRQPAFPEAEMLHWIDLMDARMNEIEGIMQRTPPGEFSEKIWSLDNRRLYHPRYTDNAE